MMNEVAEDSTGLSKMQGGSVNPAKKRCPAEGSVTFSCRLPPAPGPHPQPRHPVLREDEAEVPAKPCAAGPFLSLGTGTAQQSLIHLPLPAPQSLDNTQLSSPPLRYFYDNSVALMLQGEGYSKWSNVKIHTEL